jgi:hypothetical protein
MQPKKSCKILCHSSCCAGNNSNVTTASVNCVFLVTGLPIFTCDITFCVTDMNEINIILNTFEILRTIDQSV